MTELPQETGARIVENYSEDLRLLAAEVGTYLVVPTTGEAISPNDPAGCLRVLSEVRALESQLRDLKGALTEALQEEFQRQGTKTIELDGVKAELRGGSEVVWDVEVLEELRDRGLPPERMDQLITAEVTYKVNASVAKQLSSANSHYAEIIERAKSVIPKNAYITIK